MENTKKFDSQNKGLPSRFQLTGGKFELIGGKKKVDDNVLLLLDFVGWFRLYTQDYIIDVYQFFQNTTSYLFQFKNILRLRVMDIGKKYVPFASFYAVDVPIDYSNRKETALNIQFKYRLGSVEEYQTIKRIIL